MVVIPTELPQQQRIEQDYTCRPVCLHLESSSLELGEHGGVLTVLSERLEVVLGVIVLFCFFFLLMGLWMTVLSELRKRNGHFVLAPTGYV